MSESTPPQPMAVAFPIPGLIVADAFDQLRFAASMDPGDLDPLERRELALLPRPWDPPSCPPELRRLLYGWLDQVVAWINHQHVWRVEHALPGCWVQHPHIVHELATVAAQRWEAQGTYTSEPLELWHRYTLPEFLDRTARRVGATGCPPGNHTPFPGATRADLYETPEQSRARRAAMVTDTST